MCISGFRIKIYKCLKVINTFLVSDVMDWQQHKEISVLKAGYIFIKENKRLREQLGFNKQTNKQNHQVNQIITWELVKTRIVLDFMRKQFVICENNFEKRSLVKCEF